jgi:hypothetical protein
MAVRAVHEQIPGVVVAEEFVRERNDIGISLSALCSVFLDDRDMLLSSGRDRYFISRRLLSAFSDRISEAFSEQPEIKVHSPHVDRLVRLLQGETVVLGGAFDASQAIAELKLRGFDAAVGLKGTGAFRLSLNPEFVGRCFGGGTLRVYGKEVAVSEAGLLLLRRSELTLDETPALEELISLLRLERVVPRDASELREVTRRVGLEWAIDLDCVGAAPANDPDLADLIELEAALSLDDPLGALSKTASFRAGDWRSVIDVLFRFTSAKPSRWWETSRFEGNSAEVSRICEML